MAAGTVEAIYIAPQGGAPMQRVESVRVIAGEGLAGDRYQLASGYWARTGPDVCQVTLIRAEDLDEIERSTGMRVQNGEHRRNLVIRGIDLAASAHKRLRIGTAELSYERPRPPCRYLESMTQPGMRSALRSRAGICARIMRSGVIRQGDSIAVVDTGFRSDVSTP